MSFDEMVRKAKEAAASAEERYERMNYLRLVYFFSPEFFALRRGEDVQTTEYWRRMRRRKGLIKVESNPQRIALTEKALELMRVLEGAKSAV